MSQSQPELVAHVHNDATSVVIAHSNGTPFIAYMGTSLGDESLETSTFHRGVLGGGLDTEIFPSIIAEPQRGWMGQPGIQARRAHSGVLPIVFSLEDVLIENKSVTLILSDHVCSVAISVELFLHDSGVVILKSRVVNNGSDDLFVDAVSLSLPVGDQCDELLTLGGRHAMEAVEHRHSWSRSMFGIYNRSGRTSHEQMGVVIAGKHGFSEQSGDVWGVHCAWSGNFSLHCDSVTENFRIIQVGELLQPGEVVLQAGQTYESPEVLFAHSREGINGVSQHFHRYFRSLQSSQHRPVILNTWEAVYFKHDLSTLQKLANEAEDVGIERFVLDDGWFHGRRDDTAGLGDWWVDKSVWPQGLEPLVKHVRSLGMEFGLWFEPEMVNRQSELFRAHPEWALSDRPEVIEGRNQLVLNLALAEVRQYLFEHISLLLSTHDISYVKWDHNRPLVGGASHAQTRGVYELFHNLREAHPNVQFESCASGGGRIDAGIARYVSRFWTSDSIDALDRLTIQKGVSKLVPIEMMGSHIGSRTSHTTGRKHALSFRTATAMFGWLGVEWNLLSLQPHEKEELREAISLYKRHRPLIHQGNYFRCDHADESMHVHAVVANNKSEGLMSVSRLYNTQTLRSANIRFPQLKPEGMYSINLIRNGMPRWALHRELPNWVTYGTVMSGAQLMQLGVPCPPLLPESTLLLHIVLQGTS